MNWFLKFPLNKPKATIWTSVFLTGMLFMLVLLPNVFPQTFASIPSLKVDTDPENMLSADEPVRILHQEKKSEFDLYDQIVVGVVNETDEAGVFTGEALNQVYELTQFIQGIDGVIAPQVIAPSTVDNIEQAGLGAVRFDWLMNGPVGSDAEAEAVRDRMLRLPMMENSMVSSDGKALILYVPIEAKDMSYRISNAILEKTTGFENVGNVYHITGLPVANDTFGVQMFIQMAISAPMAMLFIFLLMWYFFKRIQLILSPMIVAMMSVIITMGALILSGNTVHIMSSMIPIFIMPIAVLDAVHILSEFYDRYPVYRDKRKTVLDVMGALWRPMLFTSLTTTAGFGSLIFTPIPPVQVFGFFVAMGVFVAWALTVIFIPAYLILLPEKSLERFGYVHDDANEIHRWADLLRRGRYAVVAVMMALALIAAYGISKININDNPVKWFEPGHPIRIADKVLNNHFAGTYPAYLVLEAEDDNFFKSPEALSYMEGLQAYMVSENEKVGKITSVVDVVKTVYRELMEGNEDYFRIPNSSRAVAQTLLSYESSHRPEDLYHFVTPDYRQATLWFQLKTGDNQDMINVRNMVDQYLKDHPLKGAKADWFGLTYINVVWQEKMVKGMLEALLSSFVIVLILMVLLFRSFWWGLLAMIPLTVTIGLIYGVIGLVGKDYDMPVAVLSSLSLGLAVDYAIHFLARSQALYRKFGNWAETLQHLFGEPFRAISRNIIVIGIGFTPLILAPLVPYQTVGIFISAILVIAGLSTLIILPALISIFEIPLFKKLKKDSQL